MNAGDLRNTSLNRQRRADVPAPWARLAHTAGERHGAWSYALPISPVTFAKEGLARVVLAASAEVDIETLKATVVESGFTPGEATVQSADD